jgi:cytidyltransferase-like protein
LNDPAKIQNLQPASKTLFMKKVMVTGCFDMLHSGHVAFLQEAAQYGDLHVCIGSDDNVHYLKGRYPIVPQDERKFMLEALAVVSEVHINRGKGVLDFLEELEHIQPDLFFVNEDGHTPEKEALFSNAGIEYKVAKRKPAADFLARSTTQLRTLCTIPFRIDLAGGWLDQPWVSKLHPGPVLTISIEPTQEFNHRSGMATSTRNKAIELWQTELPKEDPEQIAKLLFAYDNPPGTTEISGSQDALGIVMPGLNRHQYDGAYWPVEIESCQDEEVLQWLESHVYLLTLGPRGQGYAVLEGTNITEAGAKALAQAATDCWTAILQKDIQAFGMAFRKSFEAQISMFPNMVDSDILQLVEQYKEKTLGWKLSGAGGGGYLILISDQAIPNTSQIKIRRKSML